MYYTIVCIQLPIYPSHMIIDYPYIQLGKPLPDELAKFECQAGMTEPTHPLID